MCSPPAPNQLYIRWIRDDSRTEKGGCCLNWSRKENGLGKIPGTWGWSLREARAKEAFYLRIKHCFDGERENPVPLASSRSEARGGGHVLLRVARLCTKPSPKDEVAGRRRVCSRVLAVTLTFVISTRCVPSPCSFCMVVSLIPAVSLRVSVLRDKVCIVTHI